MQNGFSWVVDQQLAGMPRPGTGTSLEGDLTFLAEQGIDLLISLTEKALDASALAEAQIESLHLPVPDFRPPALDQQIEFVERTSQKIRDGGRVGVHCTAGMGRSGTMLATYLVFLGSPPGEAIAKVRELRPGSIETAEQEDAIRAYYEYLIKY
ncbi:dual specificity protein phosphatase family protein [Gemmatimonadota bacterium]